jgi:hypothetical protein
MTTVRRGATMSSLLRDRARIGDASDRAATRSPWRRILDGLCAWQKIRARRVIRENIRLLGAPGRDVTL